MRSGPLTGIRVVELAGVGPAPFCGMLLADMGADVIRIERVGAPVYDPPIDPEKNLLHRGRRQLTLNLKDQGDRALAMKLIERADVLLEGYRPGVTERLGLGPEPCLARNPRLVYARMTGWGQDGPMAHLAGHDINYFALSGSLWMSGRAGERPSPNLNLVADMGGGGMMMSFGIVCALLEARRSGQGQVVDAAMVDGAALLATQLHGYRAMGRWADERGVNLLDSGAPFYEVYETADGGFVAVGAIETKFYALLLKGLGIDPGTFPHQHDRAQWPAMKARFAEIFRSRPRAEWESVFDGSDACVTPVLAPAEAERHPHIRARATFDDPGGIVQPMPAPRLSHTPAEIAAPPPTDDSGGLQALEEWGLGPDDLPAAIRAERATIQSVEEKA